MSFTSGAKAKLDEICKVLGMAGKPHDIDGGEVARYFMEGRIKEIADYCETDIVNTYRVWLRAASPRVHFYGASKGLKSSSMRMLTPSPI